MAKTFGTGSELVLAGDIGGTNTNLALVDTADGRFDIVFKRRYSTQAERSLIEPLDRFLRESDGIRGGKKPGICCISGAGPVTGDSIELTNAPWSIDGAAITAKFGLPVRLINDFTAVSYGVILLDPSDPAQISHLPHIDGTAPLPGPGVSMVLGAGTGLGVGYVAPAFGKRIAFASEGGHTCLPCYDNLSRAFHAWMQSRLGTPPGVELGVSGQGIGNLFSFVCSRDFDASLVDSGYSVDSGSVAGARGPASEAILLAPESERPAMVAASVGNDARCRLAMEVFVRFYARISSDLAAVFLPSGGIYLAGGIAAKNESFFRGGDLFMKSFELNYARHIRDFLAGTAVMIVKNYDISLVGAANAAVTMSGS